MTAHPRAKASRVLHLAARGENRKNEIMFQKDAIVRLLRDNDPATVVC